MRWKPVLLTGGIVGGILLLLGVAAGIYFFAGRLLQGGGDAEHAMRGSSPLAAFRAQIDYRMHGNQTAFYYYHDAASREFLDQVARKHGMADGIELLRAFYGTSEISDQAKQEVQSFTEMLTTDYRLSEEIDGDRGAVVVESKRGDINLTIPMVREGGVWRHPLSPGERGFFERAAAKKFGQRKGG